MGGGLARAAGGRSEGDGLEGRREEEDEVESVKSDRKLLNGFEEGGPSAGGGGTVLSRKKA